MESDKNKKNNLMYIGFIVLVIVVLFAFFRNNQLKLGGVTGGFPILENGEYQVEDLDLPEGTYAACGLAGAGVFEVDGKEYQLSDELYKESKKKFFGMGSSVLYDKSPKVEIKENSKLKVSGTEDFTVSFLEK